MPTADETPIEYSLKESVLESSSTKATITETPEAVDHEVLGALMAQVAGKIQQIEKATDRKVTIDSITKSVPSTSLNSNTRNELEAALAEKERLRRRNLGYA